MSGQSVIFVVGAALAIGALLGSMYVLIFAVFGQLKRPANDQPLEAKEARTRFLVLVPAHNEEGGIAPTLDTLRRQRYPKNLYRVVVIADNCQDGTAATVEREGFECWVRNAPQAPGKGRALRWALDRARVINYDAVVCVDADCIAEPGLLVALERELAKGARALQVFNDFALEGRDGFSVLAVAGQRAAGALFWAPRQKLGLHVFLGGNGFCLRRDVIDQVPWTAASIVEDVEYSLELLLQGIRIDYVPFTAVTSRLSRAMADALPQRIRWASGTLQLIVRYTPRLITAGLKQRDFRLFEASLALVLSSRWVLLYGLFLAFGMSFLPLPSWQVNVIRLVAISTAALQFIYFGLVLQTVSGQGRPWRGILFLPAYLAWMVLVQCLAVLGVNRNAWTRTSR